jgi:hypothetical protein
MITYVSPTHHRAARRRARSWAASRFPGGRRLPNCSSSMPGQEGERTLNFHLSARSSFQELAVSAATSEEDERWWSISGRPVMTFNNFLGFRGSGSDLTEKRSQEHASRLARYDSLTGLANRVPDVGDAGKDPRPARGSPAPARCSCSISIASSRSTTRWATRRATRCSSRSRSGWSIPWRGGPGRPAGRRRVPGHPARPDRARRTSRSWPHRIIENLSQPYSIEGHRVVIGASVGIALSPDDGRLPKR